MNKHKYLEMIEINETYEDCLKIVIAEAVVSDTAPEITPENEVRRKILEKSKPIEVTDQSARYEILFDDYIAYAVTNESYAGGIDEEFVGRLARVYSRSAFLNYVSQGTFATDDYPGPFVHYGFCCLNQIVDIVAIRPPAMTVNNV